MKKNRYGETLVCMSVYATKDLRDDYEQLAKQDGLAISDVMRKALREYAEKRKAEKAGA